MGLESDKDDAPTPLSDALDAKLGGFEAFRELARTLERRLAYANSRNEAELKADRAVTAALSATRESILEEAAKKCEAFCYKGKDDTATGVTAYFLEPTSNLENLIGCGYAAIIRAMKNASSDDRAAG